ncbi:hypothetical protein [Leptospira santarosai]|uniref:hypothetical protein n=1 Tax=Leptospira santarosai TaxID=28183 RepID=UPI0024AF77A6|nr:hypothetical protein [Leptospira santarosai]MDI7175276.1 hypothetical protein [Leptospira santarosai]MDI7194954.1 hypothetical protein [Leptospira santarosai]MDO6399329.1 hypothetical protein [Leptospira santarosai]MDO6404795.1 hypothetical protein [Leptospira santarosai]
MDKQTMGSKNNRKSKLEKEMENLSKQLKQKEIKPMEFAENFPVKIDRLSKEDVVSGAVVDYIMDYGVKEYKEIQNDFDAEIKIVRLYVIDYLSNLSVGFEALRSIKSGKRASKLLRDRAISESRKVYPWLDDEYYPS